MELTYTDGRWKDVGVIRDMTFDVDFGDESNSFQLVFPASSGLRLETGALVYVEGTEYGGRITCPGVRTINSELVYEGPTWHGLLAERYVCPSSGQAYVNVSGEANSVIGTILSMIDTGSLFRASEVDTGVNITAQIRYTNAWMAIRAILDKAGMRPSFSYEMDHVEVSAVPYKTHEIDSMSIEISENKIPVNHLICLGKGTMQNRIRVDLFADRNKNVSRKQAIFGIDYNALVYDYSNAEEEELVKSGTEKLLELQDTSSSSIALNFTSLEDEYAVGDRLYSMDDATNVSATIVIGQKNVTLNSAGKVSVSYSPRNGSENTAIA